MKIMTTTISNDGEPLVINASDFDADKHELWEAPEQVEEDVVNDVVTAHKGGGRWTVTVNGESVHEGFLNKADAKALAEEY